MTAAPATRAFAPANISLVFETYRGAGPDDSGSLGVGCTLERGVMAEAAPTTGGDDATIHVNGEVWDFPTVRQVLAELRPGAEGGVRIDLTAAFPFGCGFGMSGASALAAAFALDRLYGLGRTPRELALVAHRAEVLHATGLGDVGGQFNGGIMIKSRRFDPLAVDTLIDDQPTLHVRVFGPIVTATVINSAERLAGINRAGAAALARIASIGKPALADVLGVAREFAEDSGLLRSPRLREALDEVDRAGGAGSMIMLGEALVADVPFPGSEPCQVAKRGVSVDAA